MANVTRIEAPNHTPEQVEEIIAEAIRIAMLREHELVPAGLIFEQACLLLGQKAVSFIAEPSPPLMAIPRGNHR